MRSARTGHRWAATIVGAILMSLASAITSSAQMFATLHNFDNEDGSEIEGPLLEATDADLYGTTYANGAYFGGTVYRITPDGAFTTIYNFCRQANCADGSDPVGGLVQGTDGSFYGTTAGGGLYDAGTVFKITRSGTLTTLYTFDIGDGAGPAGLVQGVDGDFYGATFGGGNFSSGTLFKITPTGTLTTIYNFGSQDTDGQRSQWSAGPGRRRILLWDHLFGWKPRRRDGFQRHSRRKLNNFLQFLHSLRERLRTLRSADRGHGWQLLRHNEREWHGSVRNGLQAHAQRHPHHGLQFLPAGRLPGRDQARMVGPRRRRKPLRNSLGWRRWP